MTRRIRIRVRRGTASRWRFANPVLDGGEPGLETDTGKTKYGDGFTAWNDLPYSGSGTSVSDQVPGQALRTSFSIEDDMFSFGSGQILEPSGDPWTRPSAVERVGPFELRLDGTYAGLGAGSYSPSHPGVVRFQAGTDPNGHARLVSSQLVPMSEPMRMGAWVRLRDPLSNDLVSDPSGTTYAVYVGVGDNDWGEPFLEPPDVGSLVMIRYSDSFNDGRWQGWVVGQSWDSPEGHPEEPHLFDEQVLDFGVAVEQDAWYFLEFEKDGGDVEFFCDGDSVGTVSLDPAMVMSDDALRAQIGIRKTSSTGYRTLDLDAYYVYGELAGR